MHNNIYEVHKKKDPDNEFLIIEGTIKIGCGDTVNEMPFKSVYENGFLGCHTKKFTWLKNDIPGKYDDVFVELPETMLAMQETYLSNYDLRLEHIHIKHNGIKHNYELKEEEGKE